MSGAGCSGCGCIRAAAWHGVVEALANDDMDRALDLGLVEAEPCPACSDTCRAAALDARRERVAALAARERFRSRQARLARRSAQRAAARSQPAADNRPALPASAADALARALARARGARP